MSDWQHTMRETFHRLHDGEPGGAGLTVMEEGRIVLEEVAGYAIPPSDGAPDTPWSARTMVGLASATKAMAATAALLQVERGVLDLDLPLVRWWPEFGAAGKDRVTLRDLLIWSAVLSSGQGEAPSPRFR